MDKLEDLHIEDESTATEQRFQFYIGNCRRGLVTKGKDGQVKLHWQTAGPSRIEEARVWVRGLNELLKIAERLEKGNGEKKKRRRRKRRRSL